METNSKPKFEIRQKAIEQNIDKYDELVKAYRELVIPDGKSQLCRFFLRGFCIFEENECHYAHSIEGLQFNRISLDDYIKKAAEFKENKIENDDSGDDDKSFSSQSKIIDSKRVAALFVKRSYLSLYNFQLQLFEAGEVKEIVPLEALNKDRSTRQPVRDIMHRVLQQEFVKKIFKVYGEKVLPKGFVTQCFKAIFWHSRFKKILNSHCCYEIVDPKLGHCISLLPQGKEFDDYFEDCVVRIFQKMDLINKTPISTIDFQHYYIHELMRQDPTVPDVWWYIVQKNKQLDDVLQEISTKDTLIQKLIKNLNIKPDHEGLTQLFKHDRFSNIERRDELVRAYKEKNVVGGKGVLCRFFMRGLCIFTPEWCKHAHGISDLKWKPLDLEAHRALNEKKLEEEYKLWMKKWAEILKEQQPSMNLEYTYINLLQYQETLLEQGLVSKKYTIEQLDANEDNRKDLKVLMHVALTKEFVEHLFRIYNVKYLQKSFVDRCFQSIGWMTNWARILDDEYCYEVKVPKVGNCIIKIPNLAELDPFIQDCILKIIEKNSLINSLPISPGTISKYFYKDILTEDITIPTIHIFLKKKKMSIEEYLKDLQASEAFIEKLSKLTNFPIEKLRNSVIFDSTDTELIELIHKIEKIVHDMIEKSSLGFFWYSKVEETVYKRCKKELDNYNTNYALIRRLMKAIALREGALLINLASGNYLFAGNKYEKVTAEANIPKYIKKLNNKCSRRNNQPQSHPIISDKNLIIPIDESKIQKLSDEDLEKEIDMNNIFVVDGEDGLDMAAELLKSAEAIGVDLEGQLCEGGYIDLVQIASGDQIFIFDFYLTRKSDIKLYEKIVSYIKSLMENPRICKVFQDCRKDSLALHLFAQCCPIRVFDVSGVYMFIEALKLYTTYKEDFKLFSVEKGEEIKEEDYYKKMKQYCEDTSDLIKFVEEIKTPGLNDVLKEYGASHGVNKLKDLMKKRFMEMPREYFLKRPMDKEWLIYSAKDVQDLVEVKRNMEKRLRELLKKLVGEDNENKADLLAGKISITYKWFGCFDD